MNRSIAVDGPAASGKSSTAEEVAKKLGLQRIDSGLLYRAITYLVTQKYKFEDLDLQDQETKEFIESLDIRLEKARVYHNELDITEHLRTPTIDVCVIHIAKVLYIRQKLLQIQRRIMSSDTENFIIDGRDIGTVVMPDAFLKVFVTAKDTTRALRRSKQTGQDYEEVLADLQKRDYNDINREHGKLKLAEDSVLIENDNKTMDETVEEIVKLYKSRLNNK